MHSLSLHACMQSVSRFKCQDTGPDTRAQSRAMGEHMWCMLACMACLFSLLLSPASIWPSSFMQVPCRMHAVASPLTRSAPASPATARATACRMKMFLTVKGRAHSRLPAPPLAMLPLAQQAVQEHSCIQAGPPHPPRRSPRAAMRPLLHKETGRSTCLQQEGR